VIPVLYHSYHLCLFYCTVITDLGDTDAVVRDIGDKCDRVQVSLILVILIQYSKRDIGDNLSPMSLTVLYQYQQDE
jgi:hypothetical protein